MSKQPLHDLCDEIYTQQARVEGMMNQLIDNKVILVYNRLKIMHQELDKMLSKLREKALREEGNKII